MAEAIELVPYRPLGANERYCPACGKDTLQRAPDGTEYFGGHGEADCYRRRLVFALAELQAAREVVEAARETVKLWEGIPRTVDSPLQKLEDAIRLYDELRGGSTS